MPPTRPGRRMDPGGSGARSGSARTSRTPATGLLCTCPYSRKLRLPDLAAAFRRYFGGQWQCSCGPRQSSGTTEVSAPDLHKREKRARAQKSPCGRVFRSQNQGYGHEQHGERHRKMQVSNAGHWKAVLRLERMDLTLYRCDARLSSCIADTGWHRHDSRRCWVSRRVRRYGATWAATRYSEWVG